MSPKAMMDVVASGLLSFPVTHFNADLTFDEAGYRSHIGWMCDHKPAGLFAAGGTGEFFSLAPAECARVVRAAVEEINRSMPLVAGCGYGTMMAIEYAGAMEEAGADGLLLLPPYLVQADQEGLFEHIKAVCKSTSLGVIVYNRDNAIVDDATLARLCDECPNLVGFKDGVGDIELMTRIRVRLGDRLHYVGGLPTAETFALPYQEMGVTTYSSAVFNFIPEFSMQFYAAVRSRDLQWVERALAGFVLPYIGIRNRRRGYAVSIVKAGMRVTGRPAGPVRPPFTDLTVEEDEKLKALIDGLKNLGAPAAK
ncbi:5-dehydro-4-deoxyglucarate dehydratase [Devosia sp.]|uniref:5-dehydro-4-deoxyglucarate dehydratase n=1 Tax=Devosia sp. TaxID=1871048 RepID=UPI0026109CD1|nr:5-dehydro-4-deoxyglucarate dehydratase [Devosia sp.]